MTLTWYAFPPSARDAAAPRPPKHSKLGRLTEVSFPSGQRPRFIRPPPLVAVFQPTTTTTAPCGGSRYAAIWHFVGFGRTPTVPTTNKVRGSVTGPSPADETRCHAAGSVSATPRARTVLALLPAAAAVNVRTTASETSNLIHSRYAGEGAKGPSALASFRNTGASDPHGRRPLADRRTNQPVRSRSTTPTTKQASAPLPPPTT
jgi:hypothetical protein